MTNMVRNGNKLILSKDKREAMLEETHLRDLTLAGMEKAAEVSLAFFKIYLEEVHTSGQQALAMAHRDVQIVDRWKQR